ncbi:MAG: cation transporter [Myxococcaceae bacterium]
MDRTATVIMLLLLAAPGAARAAEVYLSVEGMKSRSCAESVSRTLKQMRGVQETEVNEEFGLAWVRSSAKARIDATALAQGVTSAGYPAKPITAQEAQAIMGKAPEKAARVKAPSNSSAVVPWEPVDETFRGCEGGCGLRGENPAAVIQPGAQTGQLTYCPVSGVAFQVKHESPKADANGQAVYFCCEGCARHFAVAREEVLSKRRLSIKR